MIITEEFKNNLNEKVYDELFSRLYCCPIDELQVHKNRYLNLIENFEKIFGKKEEISVFSAPGRTEIGGNHTDHQHGCVLAGSVNLDIIAAVSLNGLDEIRIQSEGYPLDIINLKETVPAESEFNTAKALIRGVYAKFKSMGYNIKGFDAYTTSNVLKGSGLSSSAAFEVLIGCIMNGLFADNQVDAVEIARIGQFAENVYFGKPSGLMDQMASSVGGAIAIDFQDSEKPAVKKINFDFAKSGHALCIIDSGADHSDLTYEYAAIPFDMKAVAKYFDKNYLSEVRKEDFLNNISEIRKVTGDRAVLRAFHFFKENERAKQETQLLETADFDEFLKIVKESGYSSYMYLQNVCPKNSTKEQAVGYTLAMCDEILQGRGAFRVHGGGFAGTVQAFVPLDMLEDFKNKIEHTVGKNCCLTLNIRPLGGVQII